jgi:hypothetical protein
MELINSNRRKFLKQFSLLGASMLLLIAGLVWYRNRKWTMVLEDIIRTDTQSLKIDENVYQSFLKDINQPLSWMPLSPNKLLLLKFFHAYKLYVFPSPYKTIYLQSRADAVAWFLLSTSYFRNKMDAGKKIEYIMLYHPYKMPCSNPFSNIFYPR